MNKKAEEFKAYVEKTRPLAFTIEEIPDDNYETVAFRSFAEVRGNLVYAMFRVLLQELEDHYPELMKIVWD